MTTNLFVIANVKQLRTGGSFRILLPFSRTSLDVGFLNSAILTVFTIGLSLARFWRFFGILGVLKHPTLPLGTPLLLLEVFNQEQRHGYSNFT